ncbi:glycosyltransferase involved in cell wall biosynthesis [Methanothermobacter defluvii]|uniref:Glycosyltransferase involved in cell wall biosynthesis n=1 Tax=Methanothermobacter defluvii TaxID=49339 RepID=A0A371NEQ7_9EURY|nr:glycosyltransferase family 4 protein [Methanothermobacter defluvii]REE28987.1 glycosyltransferase involved in cell wall biosynthesis [Methanothermobacter defluvii]
MRICLLGEFDVDLDEAMRKTAYYLYKNLSRDHNVLKLNLRNIFSFSFWCSLRDFRPSLVHYVSGSSLKSFIILKFISKLFNAKSVISIMRPTFSKLSLQFIRFFKPDLVIVQSLENQKKFKRLGLNTLFFPLVGIETEKFCPAIKQKKAMLRSDFNLRNDAFIALHVGSIKEGRNLKWLIRLQEEFDDVQILIVGAVSQGIEEKILTELKNAGCIIWDSYFKNIEMIYALADCYVFPVLSKENLIGKSKADCIDMPLSVFEAMACNLPVVSTKFGGLPEIFEGGDGLIFVEDFNEFLEAVKYLKDSNKEIKTHKKVKMYSWSLVSRRIEDVYKKLQ